MLDASSNEGRAGDSATIFSQHREINARYLGSGLAGPDPTTSVTLGHSNFVAWSEAVAVKFSNRAAAATRESNAATLTGAWSRRTEEWEHQRDQAQLELDHIDALISAADLRTEVANRPIRQPGLSTNSSKFRSMPPAWYGSPRQTTSRASRNRYSTG